MSLGTRPGTKVPGTSKIGSGRPGGARTHLEAWLRSTAARMGLYPFPGAPRRKVTPLRPDPRVREKHEPRPFFNAPGGHSKAEHSKK